MNDINSDATGVIAHEVEKLGQRKLSASVLKSAETAGINAYKKALGSGSSTKQRFAVEKAINAVRSFGAAVQKSETDSSAEYSSDFDIGPAIPDQNAALATRALQVTGLAQAADRKLQEFGGDRNNPDDVTRAINLVISDYSYGAHETLDQMEVRAAANAHENGFVWSSNLTDQRANDEADSLNAGMGVESNFSGRRNSPSAVYSPMPAETGFSTSRGASVPGGSADGATVADASIQAIARAAFEAGVAAGASGIATRSDSLAKAARMRAAASARRGGK